MGRQLNGIVATDEQESEYIGCSKHSNNTGEITALYYALERVLTRAPGGGRDTVHSDSLYALNMATGKWMPRRKGKANAPVITKLRALWRRVQRCRPGEVDLAHVRSHTKVPGNELADHLAVPAMYRGYCMPMSTDMAKAWMTRWLRRMMADGEARDAGADRDRSRPAPTPPRGGRGDG